MDRGNDGWSALALAVFFSWKPGRLAIGAMLFGGMAMLQLNLQAAGVEINAAYMFMAPFIVTIFGLGVMSGARFRHTANASACWERRSTLPDDSVSSGNPAGAPKRRVQ